MSYQALPMASGLSLLQQFCFLKDTPPIEYKEIIERKAKCRLHKYIYKYISFWRLTTARDNEATPEFLIFSFQRRHIAFPSKYSLLIFSAYYWAPAKAPVKKEFYIVFQDTCFIFLFGGIGQSIMAKRNRNRMLIKMHLDKDIAQIFAIRKTIFI